MTSVGHRTGTPATIIKSSISSRGGGGFLYEGGRNFRASNRGTRSGVHVSINAQNYLFSDQPSGAASDSCTISGRYILDLGATSLSDTWTEFLALTQADIENQLTTAFLPDCNFSTTTRGLLVLDIEGTADGHSSHPSNLGTESAANQALIIAAWQTRIRAVQAVFPYAKVSLYGTLVPNSRGLETASYLTQRTALIAAGAAGAFDRLDVLSPVMYPRFGPSDIGANWNSWDEMTAQAIRDSRLLLKSDGSSIPLVPLITCDINNGNSNDNTKMLLDLPTTYPLERTWGIQIDTCKSMNQYHVAFWVGGTNTQVIHFAGNTRGYTVNYHTQRLLNIGLAPS